MTLIFVGTKAILNHRIRNQTPGFYAVQFFRHEGLFEHPLSFTPHCRRTRSGIGAATACDGADF
jgi:hypothetical protein